MYGGAINEWKGLTMSTHIFKRAKVLKFSLCCFFLAVFIAPANGQNLSKSVEWQITEVKQLSSGTVTASEKGKTRMDMAFTGKAVTNHPEASFSEGIFTIKVNAFKPGKVAPPGAAKDHWQLRGEWTITALNADPAVVKARHNPYLLAGVLTSQLPFDPAEKVGSLTADVRLQRGGTRPWAGQKAKGAFVGNTQFEGTLTTPIVPDPMKK